MKYFDLTNLPPHIRNLDIDDQMLWLAFYRSGAGTETSSIDDAQRRLVGIFTDGADAAEYLLARNAPELVPSCPTLPDYVVVDYDATWQRHLRFLFLHDKLQNWLYVFRFDR
jgi:hypothetical protein